MADATPSRPRLLLLEDEVPLAEATKANLAADYDVDWTASAKEALQMLDAGQYAAILSDHMLPDKQQGLDFLMAALQRQPAAKRILMTGYLNPDLLGRSVQVAQLSACLIKPVPMEKLRQELHRLLAS